MPNSDNTYGTFNKQTNIYSQQVGEPFTLTWDGGSETETPVGVTFSTVDEAKNWFFTADALAVFNECCTTLEWALVDNDKLKATFDFGTKGALRGRDLDDAFERVAFLALVTFPIVGGALPLMMKGKKRVPSAAAGAVGGFLLWLTVFKLAQRVIERMADAPTPPETKARA